jgi:hypothetical protein
MRWTQARFQIVGLAVVVLVAGGCDALTGDDKSISLTFEDDAVTLGQGSADSVLITVNRSNYNDPVTLSIEGTLPPGVTASFTVNPIPTSLTTTHLRFVATGSAAPASGTVTVRATGNGIDAQTQQVDFDVVVTGSYTLGTLYSTVTAAQGGGADATILLTRSGGNAGNVSLTLSGAPAGVTPTFTQSPTVERGLTLSLAVAASVAPGTYSLTIGSSSPGITPDQSTPLTLVVTAPPTTTSVSLPFCSGSNLPIWFAHLNEGFPWQRVTPTGSAFTFAASDRVGIAYVLQGGNEFQMNVFYATRSELLGLTDRDCDGNKTLTGTVAGLTAGQSAIVVLGANGTTTTTTNYTLQGVASRPLDLIATRGTVDDFTGYVVPDRMIIRRSQDLTGTIPALDFTTAEAFATEPVTLTVSGFTSGFALEFNNTLWSATASYGALHSGVATGGSSTLHTVPAAQLAAGDLHELFIDAFQSNFQNGHALVSYFAGTGNRTETLGPLLSVPAVTMPATSPYVRMRGQLPSQVEYPSAVRFVFLQGLTGSRKLILLVTTAAYLGGTPTTWDLLVPDLGTVAGFNTAWMFTTGQSTPFSAEGYAARGDLLFGALPTIGETIKFGYRISQTSTAWRVPGVAARRDRRSPLATQYFSR